VTGTLCASSRTPCATCTAGTNTCNFGGPAAQPLYVYGIQCMSANHMQLYRYWFELLCVSPSYQYAQCGCSAGSGAEVYSASGSVAVTCGSIAWSGTLTKIVGNLSDPVSGTTSFSQ
jgi:hypothetical protein